MRPRYLAVTAVTCLLVAVPFGLSAVRRLPDYRRPRSVFQGSPTQRARIDATIEAVEKEGLDQLVEGVPRLEEYWVALALYQGPDSSIRGRFSLMFASRRFLRILDHLDSLATEKAKQESRRISRRWLDIHRQSMTEALGQYATPARAPTREISMVGAHVALCASAFLTARYCGLQECREWMRTIDQQSRHLLDVRTLPSNIPKHVVLVARRFAGLDALTKISILANGLAEDKSITASQAGRAVSMLKDLVREEEAITDWNAKVGVFDLAVINEGGWPDFATGNARRVVNYEWGSAVIGKRTLMTDEALQRNILRDFEAALP